MKCSRISVAVTAAAAALTFMSANQVKASITSGPDIITPPASVNNEDPRGGNPGGGVINTHLQGFNERQGVLLTSDLAVDGGVVPAGTTVDSHMIFYNFVDKPNDGNPYSDGPDDWQFSGEILGVMSDDYGVSEVASSSILGAPSTTYPIYTYQYRGLDTSGDNYTIDGSTLALSSGGYAPGDWVRVVTLSSTEPSVPVMSEWGMLVFFILLMASGLWITKRRQGQESA